MRPNIPAGMDVPPGSGRIPDAQGAVLLRLFTTDRHPLLRIVTSPGRHRALSAPGRAGAGFTQAKPTPAFPGRPATTGAGSSPLPFQEGERIYRQGTPALHWYEVVSGAVRALRLLPDGRRQVVGFHLAGDLFGFDDAAGMHSLTLEAAAESETVVLRHCRQRLEALAGQDASFACWLGAFTRQGLCHAHAHLLLLGRKSSMERLASFLLEMRERLPPSVKEGPSAFCLPMDRTDIADYLGVTIETVCRGFQALRRRGVIELHGHRRVRILDIRELQATSGDLLGDARAAMPMQAGPTGFAPLPEAALSPP